MTHAEALIERIEAGDSDIGPWSEHWQELTESVQLQLLPYVDDQSREESEASE